MSKLSITDPTIRVKPGPRLATFIVNLTDPIALPENVLKIYQSFGGDASVEHTKHQTEVAKPSLGPSDLELLGKLDRNEIGGDVQTELAKLISTEDEEIEDIEADHDDDDGKPLSKSEAKRLKEKQKEQQRSKLTLNLNDLKWLNELLVERRKLDGDDQQQYLHWLMADATLVLPSNEIRVRNPELEARCVRLRLEQNARVYNAMTRNVDTSRRLIPDDTIAFQSEFGHTLAFKNRLLLMYPLLQLNSETNQSPSDCRAAIPLLRGRWFCVRLHWRRAYCRWPRLWVPSAARHHMRTGHRSRRDLLPGQAPQRGVRPRHQRPGAAAPGTASGSQNATRCPARCSRHQGRQGAFRVESRCYIIVCVFNFFDILNTFACLKNKYVTTKHCKAEGGV